MRYNRRMPLPPEFVDTARAAADAARALTRKYFRARLAVGSKTDNSPVTRADRETEQLIKEMILSRHPRHGFFGEESGGAEGDGEWRWVIDPIDGTKAFATGNPAFGTLIALLQNGRPVLGLIDYAALDERWLGVTGGVTLHNGAPCKTSDVRALQNATLYATTQDMFAGGALRKFESLSRAVRFRVFGGDGFCYGLLAAGFTDVVCEASLFAYDYLALVPVVEGAGGVITDWRGGALTADSSGEVLAAANVELHAAALQFLVE